MKKTNKASDTKLEIRELSAEVKLLAKQLHDIQSLSCQRVFGIQNEFEKTLLDRLSRAA